MIKLLLGLGLVFVTFSSFMCSKQQDDVAMRSQSQQDENVVNVDFTHFPAHTIFTITDDISLDKWVFDSDSSKVFTALIPQGTYSIKWRLMGLVADKKYKALLSYHGPSSMNADWVDNTFNQKGWKIWGTYVFSRESR